MNVINGLFAILKSRKVLILIVLLLASAILAIDNSSRAQIAIRASSPAIPRVWDDEEMATLQLPLADETASPIQISAEYYYSIPLRPIFKSYPVYAPGKEPDGYLEKLQQQEPEMAVDMSKLKTEADWIKAGEIVFESPLFYNVLVTLPDVRDPAWYEQMQLMTAKDGTLPWFRYVVREKGKVELGTIACAMCHTRVLPDGAVVKGAQGNFPFELAGAAFARKSMTLERLRRFERSFFDVPWVKPNPLSALDQMSVEEIAQLHTAIPPGVIARHGTNPLFPTQVPDLIGVKDRKYLDHTGLQLHRSIVDLMRYAALNVGADELSSYGGFIPAAKDSRTLPASSTQLRYSDEQLYALAMFIYSLEAPKNPNKMSRLAKRGQQIFSEEGCAGCHTPPLYTNNKLTPVNGVNVRDDHPQRYDIGLASVGTDPRLALQTRRGTGFYKVPSLRGVWYRGPFEHNGSVATLEDWFDPKRLQDNYLPTGFRGAGVKSRAVKGHRFGLSLSLADRQALIAFLKTL